MNTLTKLLVTTLIATFSITSFATAPTAQKKKPAKRYDVYDKRGNALNNPKEKTKQLDNVINMQGLNEAKSVDVEGDTIVFG